MKKITVTIGETVKGLVDTKSWHRKLESIVHSVRKHGYSDRSIIQVLGMLKQLKRFHTEICKVERLYVEQCQQQTAINSVLVRIVERNTNYTQNSCSITVDKTLLRHKPQSLKVDDTVLRVIDLQLTIENLDQCCVLFAQYCYEYTQLVQMLVDGYKSKGKKKDRRRSIVRAISYLMASTKLGKWNNCKPIHSNEYGIHGNVFHHGNTDDHIRCLIHAIKYVTAKTDQRISVQLGQSHREISSPYTSTVSEYDSYHADRYRQRLSWRMDRVRQQLTNSKTVWKLIGYRHRCLLSRYEQQRTVIFNARRFKGASVALTKLIQLKAANSSPYVFTVPISKPVVIGTVNVLNHPVNVLRFDCKTDQSNRVNGCYILERTASARINTVIQGVEWLHLTESEEQQRNHTDLGLAGNVFQVLQSRVDNELTNAPKSEAELRKEKAIIARKLIRLETVNMLDSQAVGNCHPGTLQFCNSIGVELPPQANVKFINYAIPARYLLRLWKQSGYTVDRLFYKLVNETHDKLMKRTVELTCYY